MGNQQNNEISTSRISDFSSMHFRVTQPWELQQTLTIKDDEPKNEPLDLFCDEMKVAFHAISEVVE